MNTTRTERWVVAAILAVSMASLIPTVVNAQFQYPPYGSLRGRMVYRDGLFHSVRYRWGNGLTPYGAAVLTTGIQTAGQVLPVIFTGQPSADDGDRSTAAKDRSADIGDWCHEYAEEQRRATEALTRVEDLLRSVLGESPATKPNGAAIKPESTPKPAMPAADAVPSVGLEEERKTKIHPKQEGATPDDANRAGDASNQVQKPTQK